MEERDPKIQLQAEIAKSLLLSEADKSSLLSGLDAMPRMMVEYLLKTLREKNLIVDEYVERALRDNPGILPELKEKISKMKINLLQLEESEEANGKDAEKVLEEKLNKL